MTKSMEDYLEIIHVLIRDRRVARVRDVAASLNVKMPSVVKAIGELKKLELVRQEPYGDIELTEKGARLASMILARHTVLKAFLMKLGVSEENAEKAYRETNTALTYMLAIGCARSTDLDASIEFVKSVFRAAMYRLMAGKDI